ncbi:hypothetical protein T459_16865 [Capsicum annuum]|uniref:Uncharacterized protein n=1 Tax=Capsicum annuum TaxID=4072 RepID=A0A2G2Z9X3_CAPAN|nr:hypothetical protein T459_16865 [Capsicum annuum]
MREIVVMENVVGRMLNHPWQQYDFNSQVEILVSSSKTPLTIEKPDNVQVLENPHQFKTQDSSKSVVGPDSKELLLSSKEVTSNPRGKVKANVESKFLRQLVVTMSIFDGKKVISELKKEFIMKAWASICTKLNLLGSFFGLATFYDQARSALVNKTIKIKESEPSLKAKEHLKIVLRERDEKSKEVSTSNRSLEKARKNMKKLKDRRDAAKEEAVEMESNVSTAE